MEEGRESEPGTRRLFLALELAPAAREALGQLVREMRPIERAVKYVAEQNVHLTLKFLGGVEEGRIAEIVAATRGVAERFHPFEYRVAGLGVFPSESRPRVLWAGFVDSGEAAALQAGLEEAFGPLGFPKEDRPFRAHLTIGRVRTPAKMPGLMRWVDRNRHRDFGDGRTGEVILFESRLRSEGPIYTAIERLPLGDG